IDLDLDLVLAAIMRLGGALHGFFHGGDDDGLVDRLVARHRVGDLQQFGSVSGNGSHTISPRIQNVVLQPASSFYCSADARLRAFKSSAMSASLSTSLASAICLNGRLTRLSWVCTTTSLPSSPKSVPRKRLRPSIGVCSSIFASCPDQRAKSISRVSGRSMPGEDTS